MASSPQSSTIDQFVMSLSPPRIASELSPAIIPRGQIAPKRSGPLFLWGKSCAAIGSAPPWRPASF